MKTHKMDRRSERTRRMLGVALLSLLQEKRYEDITVQDLLERADIGRSTFYAQYYDKDDLLTSQMEYVVMAMSKSIDSESSKPENPFPVLGLLQHIYEQRHKNMIPSLLRGRGGELVMEGLRVALTQRVEQYWKQHMPPQCDEKLLAVTIQAGVWAFLGVLRWWIDQDMKLPPEKLNVYFQQAIAPVWTTGCATR
jgi:AcrR family transcriptional regulator